MAADQAELRNRVHEQTQGAVTIVGKLALFLWDLHI